MFLKELDLGHETKCTCVSCKATGIYKGFAEHDDLGVVCNHCNGKGYYTLELNENMQLVQDEKTGIVYEVNDGLIVGSVSLFNKLQKRDDVNYVMYSTGRVFSPEYLFEHGASEINVITYEEFIQGKLPLPMMNILVQDKYHKVMEMQNLIMIVDLEFSQIVKSLKLKNVGINSMVKLKL